jgi:hypothetical protein
VQTVLKRSEIDDLRARSRTVRTALLATSLALLLVGCDMDFEIPTTARITANALSSPAGTRMLLVTASELQSASGSPQDVYLIHADTTELTLPFDRDVEIRSHDGARKLYVEVRPVQPSGEQVRVKIVISDLTWYDLSLDLSERYHRFLYVRQ